MRKGHPTSTVETISWIKSEHLRWLSSLNNEDPYAGNITIGIKEVLQAHFLLMEYFANIGEGVGGIGPKDLALLHSALNRQFVEYQGRPKWNNRLEICATLMYGLIKNHPFHDANKRTAFLTSLLHLQKIGRTPKVTHSQYEDFTVDISDDNLEKYSSKKFNSKDSDECVRVIAEFLRKSTRDIDLANKRVTYRELVTILSKFGLLLKNPKGNRIDLVRFRDYQVGIDIPEVRLAHIGFHGWTKEVSNKDIHIIRNAAKLDPKHGYDSQSFFNGVETPLSLIEKYREPLQRLAYR